MPKKSIGRIVRVYSNVAPSAPEKPATAGAPTALPHTVANVYPRLLGEQVTRLNKLTTYYQKAIARLTPISIRPDAGLSTGLRASVMS